MDHTKSFGLGYEEDGNVMGREDHGLSLDMSSLKCLGNDVEMPRRARNVSLEFQREVRFENLLNRMIVEAMGFLRRRGRKRLGTELLQGLLGRWER